MLDCQEVEMGWEEPALQAIKQALHQYLGIQPHDDNSLMNKKLSNTDKLKKYMSQFLYRLSNVGKLRRDFPAGK